MARPWTPRINVARRIAGRLVRAHTGEAICLTFLQRQDCVDAITMRFLSTQLRRTMGELWRTLGPDILDSGWADPRIKPHYDEELDRMVRPEVE